MATYSSYKKISGDALVAGTLTGTQLTGLTISQGNLANNAVTNTQLVSASLNSGNFASNAVGASQLASSLDFSSKTMTYRSLTDADFATGAAIGTSKFLGTVSAMPAHGLATSAFTDTTNAANITSGTLGWNYGGRGATNVGFSVKPTSTNNSQSTIAWTTANSGHVTGTSSNTFGWDGSTVTVYQPGVYVCFGEVITAPSSGPQNMYYYVNGGIICDFRGGTSSSSANHAAVSGAILLNLSANDTVNMQCRNWHVDYYSRWSFTKLGGWA